MNRIFVLRSEDNAKQLYACLKKNWPALAKTKKPLSVHVSLHTEKKTHQQRKRLHKLLTIISEQAWEGGRQFPMLAWKKFYAEKYLGAHETELPNGEVRRDAFSTEDLNREEYTEFMFRVELDAIETYGVDFEQ